MLANSGVIYYQRLQYGFEQERLLAKHYSPLPLGGFAGWADLVLEARPRAKAGALAAENGGGSLPLRLHVVTCQAGAEAAATLEAGS